MLCLWSDRLRRGKEIDHASCELIVGPMGSFPDQSTETPLSPIGRSITIAASVVESANEISLDIH